MASFAIFSARWIEWVNYDLGIDRVETKFFVKLRFVVSQFEFFCDIQFAAKTIAKY